MFLVAQLVISLARLFDMVFSILYFLIVIRIILSWFSVDPYNEVARVLYAVTDPILKPLRRFPLQIGMIDFSPIVAFLILGFLHSFIVGALRGFALQMGS